MGCFQNLQRSPAHHLRKCTHFRPRPPHSPPPTPLTAKMPPPTQPKPQHPLPPQSKRFGVGAIGVDTFVFLPTAPAAESKPSAPRILPWQDSYLGLRSLVQPRAPLGETYKSLGRLKEAYAWCFTPPVELGHQPIR